MPARTVAQLAFDEHVIEDADLEEALEERHKRRESLRAVRLFYKEADERAKGEIAKQELSEGVALRVGRFRITRTDIPPRSVSFDTQGSSRLTIALVDDD